MIMGNGRNIVIVRRLQSGFVFKLPLPDGVAVILFNLLSFSFNTQIYIYIY